MFARIPLFRPLVKVALPSGSGRHRKVAIGAMVTFALVGLMLVRGFPRGYESTAYHLPIAVHMFQAQSLEVWDTVGIHAYPANISVYFGFLLGFIPERLVAAGGMVFLVPLFVAIYALSRATTAEIDAARWAALGILTIPIVAFGAFEAAADVPAIVFLAIALYFAVTTPASPVLSGLAAGLAFGFKPLHLISIAFLFVVLLLREWASRDHSGLNRFWSTGRPAILFGFSTLGIASFWLVRNYVELGNPLYPIHYGFFDLLGWAKAPDADFADVGMTQFEWVRTPAEWFLYPWLEWHFAGQNFKASSGLGAFFAATVPVACAVSFVQVFRTGTDRQPLAYLLTGGTFVLFTWALLGDRQPRYAMAALVFLVPLVAAMISLTQGSQRRFLEWIIGLCVFVMLFVIMSKEVVEFGRRFVYARQNTRHAFYRYPETIDRLPEGSTVVNFARRTLNYGLYGEKHRNRVIGYFNAYRSVAVPTTDWIPESAPEAARLEFSTLKKLGATHLVTEGSPRLLLDGCVSLQQLDSLDINPGLGTPLEKPITLYQISYCN
ncbi:MAG TPA: hypothetical protein VNO43_15715 [Candidatus Eisenbacteria bacterium]|nr:hypothetical protein [Candidatus Eisenbacteria bacterium]